MEKSIANRGVETIAGEIRGCKIALVLNERLAKHLRSKRPIQLHFVQSYTDQKLESIQCRNNELGRRLQELMEEYPIVEPAICRHLCEKIQCELPRELRDIVYGHFTTLEDVEFPDARAHHKYIMELWTSDRFGADTLHEVFESLYARSSFVITGDILHKEGQDNIRKMLSMNIPRSGMPPAKLVREIEFKVYASKFLGQKIVKTMLNFERATKLRLRLHGWFRMGCGRGECLRWAMPEPDVVRLFEKLEVISKALEKVGCKLTVATIHQPEMVYEPEDFRNRFFDHVKGVR